MGKQNSKNSFIIQGSILAAASIIVRLIGLLYRIPMNNILGDEGIGYYSVAFEIYSIGLLLSSYSLPMAVSKLVAAKMERREYRNAYKIFKASMMFSIVIGLAMSLIIYFMADWIAEIMRFPGSSYALKVLAPTIFVFSITGVYRGFFQGKSTMMPTSFSQILEQIINAIVSIAAPMYLMTKFAKDKQASSYAAAGATFGTLMGVVTALAFLMFIYSAYKPRFHNQMRHDRSGRVSSYGTIYTALFVTIVPIVLSQTVYQLSGTIDNAMYGILSAAKGVSYQDRTMLIGIYSGKYRLLTNVPVAISSALGASMIPSIVASRVRKDKKEVKYKVRTTIKFNMLIAIPSAVGMGVLATPILQLLFHDTRKVSGELLALGSVAIVFFSLSTVTNAVLQGIDLMKLSVIHSAISLVIHVILNYVLLNILDKGIYSLVIGNVTFALVVCILNWRAVGKRLHYRQEVMTTFVIPTLCAGIMGVAAYFTYRGIHTLTSSNTLGVLAAMVIACIVYFICILLFRVVTEEELKDMPLGRKMFLVARKLHLM